MTPRRMDRIASYARGRCLASLLCCCKAIIDDPRRTALDLARSRSLVASGTIELDADGSSILHDVIFIPRLEVFASCWTPARSPQSASNYRQPRCGPQQRTHVVFGAQRQPRRHFYTVPFVG